MLKAELLGRLTHFETQMDERIAQLEERLATLERPLAFLFALYSRYRRPYRSTAQGGVCHEASAPPVAQPNRSSATGRIDNHQAGASPH
jgi:hypothetical protein